jgi:acetylornithine deacetylase/succinyl-diaminopimelate desuccinylase-like protein
VPPFSGLERDGFIHGRGTLDNKNSVMVWNTVFSALGFQDGSIWLMTNLGWE